MTMDTKDLANDLAVLARRLGDLDAVTMQAADIVLAAARPPRRTGRLAASLHVDARNTGAAVTSDLPYAGVIHNGWAARNIRPQPFLTDALAASERDVVDIFHDHITDLIRSA